MTDEEKFETELLGSGASIEDLEEAFAAPPEELPVLSAEEEKWVRSMGVDVEDYRRNRYAENLHARHIKQVVRELVTFVKSEIARDGANFRVTKVVWEPDRETPGFFRFRIFVQGEANETRSFLISEEDGSDFAESRDAVAAQRIRETVRGFLKVNQGVL
ncbi:MAG TPA: hypothetical protein VF905_00265 [Nitrospirota bacterium]